MNLISSIVESDTSLQNLTQVLLQRLDEFDVKFAKQERTIETLQKTIAGQERTNEILQKTIAGLSTKVARVGYPSSDMTPSLTYQILHSKHKYSTLSIAA